MAAKFVTIWVISTNYDMYGEVYDEATIQIHWQFHSLYIGAYGTGIS